MNGRYLGVTTETDSVGTLPLTVVGDVDLGRIMDLRTRLELVVAARPAVVEIDLAAVTFIDSAGLALLQWCVRRGSQEGVCVRLASPSRAVTRLLHATGTERWFALAG